MRAHACEGLLPAYRLVVCCCHTRLPTTLHVPPSLRADYTFVLACNSDEHYCLQFPASPTAGEGESPPTLCLPRPEGCGAAGGTCCPLTGDTENGSQRCNAEGTLCLAPNATTIYGRWGRAGALPAAPGSRLPLQRAWHMR